MNIPKAFEIALSRTVRQFGDLPSGVALRPWQTLTDDASWKEGEDRTFPMVEFRASPPTINADQTTMMIPCAILCGEMADDDKDHATISDLYQRVYNVINALFNQFRAGTTGEEIAKFAAVMAELVSAGTYNFGGFSYDAGLAPYDDKGVNMIGITFVLHYSTDEF